MHSAPYNVQSLQFALLHIISQIISVYPLPPSSTTHFNRLLSLNISPGLPGGVPSGIPTKRFYAVTTSSMCAMWTNNLILLNFVIPLIYGESIIIKILSTEFAPVSCDVLTLSSKRSHQHTVFRRLQSVLFALYERPSFSPI